MIEIKHSPNSDTRSGKKPISKQVLRKNTESHVSDVIQGCEFFSQLLMEQAKQHDHTKLYYLDEFYQAFSNAQQGEQFKDHPWWKKHLEERHHLLERTPADVNLLDVIEMVVDCTMAGLARSGDVYPIEIPSDILQKAVANTVSMIISKTEVNGEVE